jgi:hypothetical protein
MYSAVGLVESPKFSESEAQRQSADQREELQKMRQVAGAVGTKMAMGRSSHVSAHRTRDFWVPNFEYPNNHTGSFQSQDLMGSYCESIKGFLVDVH